MENRNGLLVDLLITPACGAAERDAIPQLLDGATARDFRPRTLGGDKGYDTLDCVADLRARGVTPHFAQNHTKTHRSAIDGRTTTRDPSYAVSQRIRKRIEIVCTQVTKPGVGAGLRGRDDLPDLHRAVGDDDPVDQQFD